ncbi:Transcription factor E4F1 [Frankliniella fusca]|uniref:Transcription factor E4F1 n=1 Tax=Frankliniella fusca TaxID=407009 RepID=A0AAE1H8P7_9NEOP|nr:Transcription factor E4F1 [Frankliniella fusca]
MSGDLFAELNEDSPSETQQSDIDTPIEFSGVSGGPSPPKPSHSLLPQAQPLAPTTATASKDELIFCKFCKKTYKTWRNFEKHMMTKHPGQKVEAGQQQSELSAASSSKTSTDSVSFLCQKCSKSVKSSAALIRHMAGHKVQELNQKKPEPAEFLIVQGDVTRKIIEEMLKESNYGERSKLKMEFLQALLTSESFEWLDLVNELSTFICSVACDRESKQLPINQYEKSQAKLNTYLNDAILYDRLTETLVSLAPQEISIELAGRLLSRFAFKLMDEVQNWVSNTLRQNEDEIFEQEEFNMNPVEEKAFIINLGNIFRAFFKKGLHSSAGQLQSQSACLTNTFIVGTKPVSSMAYLNKKNGPPESKIQLFQVIMPSPFSRV